MEEDSFIRIPTLFEGSSCPSCPAGDVCLGSATAPCGCSRTGAERYDCGNCHLVCRERREHPGQRYDEEFEIRLAEGRALDEVQIFQDSRLGMLPVLIPMRTRDLHPGDARHLRAVGYDLEDLLTAATKGGQVSVQRHLKEDESAFRTFAGASPSTTLLAVLNGDDDRLEGLWGAHRVAFLQQLHSLGVRAITGPTFSIYDNEPASHRTLMVMRHHQMLHEAGEVGLLPIPNLYWRDEHDIYAWAEWLKLNPHVHTVSRDFSRTKQKPFYRQFDGLLHLLLRVGRPLHVVIVGVGAGRGAFVLSQLGAVTCTGSIATASPIIMAQKGRQLVPLRGRLEEAEERVADRQVLAWENVQTLAAHLTAAATLAADALADPPTRLPTT